MKRNIPAAMAALLLAGCSGGPSSTDIQKAVQAVNERSEITNVQQASCTAATEGRYRCSFKVTIKNGNWVRDRELSQLFEKRPSGWALAGE